MAAAAAPLLSLNSFYNKHGSRYKRGSGAYTRYVHDYKVHALPVGQLTPGLRPSTAGAPAQPLGHHAPTIAAHALADTNADSGYLTDAQIQAKAKKLVDAATAPLLARLNSMYNTTGETSAAAINAATKEYEQAVGGYAPAVGAAYQGAEAGQAGTDAALAKLLTGGGTQGAQDLAAQLGSAPGSAEAQAGAQGVARGAAGASLGTGSADLTALLSKGADEAAYGAKLPGLAALTGLRDTTAAQTANEKARADAIANATSSEPGSILSLYQNLANSQATEKNQAANRAQTAELAAETLGLNTGKATVAANQQNASLQERIRHDEETEANAAASVQERDAAAADARAAKAQQKQLTAKTKQTAAHATAIKNRGSALTQAKGGLQTLARAAAHPKATKQTVQATTPGGTPIKGKTTTKTVPGKPPPYKTLLRQALLDPYVQALLNKFAYKPAQIRAMLDEYLRAYGYPVPGSRKAAVPVRGDHASG